MSQPKTVFDNTVVQDFPTSLTTFSSSTSEWSHNESGGCIWQPWFVPYLVSRLHRTQATSPQCFMTRSMLFLYVFVVCCLAPAPNPWALRSHRYPTGPVVADNNIHINGLLTGEAGSLCYSCFFRSAGIIPNKKLVPYFQSVSSSKDPLISGDARFIVWRATEKEDCGALDAYRAVGGAAERRLAANADIGFSAWECNRSGSDALKQASIFAARLGRKSEARALNEISAGKFRPKFGDTNIETLLVVPTDAHTMVLGESTILLTAGMRIGTQVERVYRDWLGEEFGGEGSFTWDVSMSPTAVPVVRDPGNRAYHEGALVEEIQRVADVNVVPLFGTLIARNPAAPDPDGEGQWYAPDEQGVFRFKVLIDKVQYPTTHTSGDVGWITDTHGISAIVSQALEYKSQLVIGCGDYEGKVKAAYYLARHGVNVVFPGDRFEHMLIGYKGKGVLMGTAPVKRVGGAAVLGHQPVKFSLSELIVAEDTSARYPTQYYDTPARYFRQLSKFVPLNVVYMNVDDENQLNRVLDRAASVVAVRIKTDKEDGLLRWWLLKSAKNRAILFHSGLYPYAQGLFRDFPTQVTFGDLHPRFE
jgi:hypothetical protein